MATKPIPLNKLATTIEGRIKQRLGQFSPNDKEYKAAVFRAALLLQSQIKKNISDKKIVDQGGLLNSIEIKLVEDGAVVGAVGVPYAAIHEFGGEFTAQMRKAMFATLRKAGRLNGQSRNKNVIVNGRIRPRPYLRPAIKQQSERIVQIFTNLFRNRK